GLFDAVAKLARHQLVVRVALLEGLPVPGHGPGAVGAEEPVLLPVVARLARAARRRNGGERSGARLAARARARTVHEDPEDPGLQGGPAFETLQAAEHGEPGVLDDFFGVGAGADVGPGEAEHRGVPAVEEPLERLLVALTQRTQQELLLVVERGGPCGRRQVGVRQRADSLARAAQPLAIARV